MAAQRVQHVPHNARRGEYEPLASPSAVLVGCGALTAAAVKTSFASHMTSAEQEASRLFPAFTWHVPTPPSYPNRVLPWASIQCGPGLKYPIFAQAVLSRMLAATVMPSEVAVIRDHRRVWPWPRDHKQRNAMTYAAQTLYYSNNEATLNECSGKKHFYTPNAQAASIRNSSAPSNLNPSHRHHQ